MNNKLVCPFCEYELQENRTTNLCCPICGLVAPTKLWQALIQAKQDLEIATKALDKADRFFDGIIGLYQSEMHAIIKTALEQIEHKE